MHGQRSTGFNGQGKHLHETSQHALISKGQAWKRALLDQVSDHVCPAAEDVQQASLLRAWRI